MPAERYVAFGKSGQCVAVLSPLRKASGGRADHDESRRRHETRAPAGGDHEGRNPRARSPRDLERGGGVDEPRGAGFPWPPAALRRRRRRRRSRSRNDGDHGPGGSLLSRVRRPACGAIGDPRLRRPAFGAIGDPRVRRPAFGGIGDGLGAHAPPGAREGARRGVSSRPGRLVSAACSRAPASAGHSVATARAIARSAFGAGSRRHASRGRPRRARPALRLVGWSLGWLLRAGGRRPRVRHCAPRRTGLPRRSRASSPRPTDGAYACACADGRSVDLGRAACRRRRAFGRDGARNRGRSIDRRGACVVLGPFAVVLVGHDDARARPARREPVRDGLRPGGRPCRTRDHVDVGDVGDLERVSDAKDFEERSHGDVDFRACRPSAGRRRRCVARSLGSRAAWPAGPMIR